MCQASEKSEAPGQNKQFPSGISIEPANSSTSRGLVVFIHGWNVAAPTAKEMWQPMRLGVESMLSASGSEVDYAVFLYDWTQPIDSNGRLLATELSKLAKQKPIVIVAHSMGGLVARSAIEDHWKFANIPFLVTIGTPHHGTPIGNEDWMRKASAVTVHTGNLLDPVEVSKLKNLDLHSKEVGTQNLAYDNFDYIMPVDLRYGQPIGWGNVQQTKYIAELNARLFQKDMSAYLRNYHFIGGYLENIKAARTAVGAVRQSNWGADYNQFAAIAMNRLLDLYKGKTSDFAATDGPVPLVSSLFLKLGSPICQLRGEDVDLWREKVDSRVRSGAKCYVTPNGVNHTALPSNSDVINRTSSWIEEILRRKHQGAHSNSSLISLVIDRSDSMNSSDGSSQTRWQSAVDSAKKLLKMLETEGEAFGSRPLVDLIFFDRDVQPIPEPTADYASLVQALDSTRPQNNTNITDALIIATQRLQDPRYSTMSRSIVLLSDGAHNATSQRPTEAAVLQGAIDAQIKIYTVGLGTPGSAGYEEDVLRTISSGTGGQFYSASDAYNLTSVFLSARHTSMGQSLLAQQGVFTTPGQQKVGNFDPSATKQAVRFDPGAAYAQVPVDMPALMCSLNYDGGSVAMVLKDPSGKTVDPTYPGATVVAGQPALAIIKDPKPGTWAVLADPSVIPASGIRYSFEASGRSNAALPGGGGGGNGGDSVLTGAVAFSTFIVLLIALRLAIVLRNRSGRPLPVSTGPSLRVVSNGMVRTLTGDKIVIGRASSSGLCLVDDDEASQKHALIYSAGGTWRIRDLGSRNGLLLNGQPIASSALNQGDTLVVGTTVIRIL